MAIIEKCTEIRSASVIITGKKSDLSFLFDGSNLHLLGSQIQNLSSAATKITFCFANGLGLRLGSILG